MHEVESPTGLTKPGDSDSERLEALVVDIAEQLNYQTQVLNAMVVVLMRIYDVELAGLEVADTKLADRVYDEHVAGNTNQPEILVPE